MVHDTTAEVKEKHWKLLFGVRRSIRYHMRRRRFYEGRNRLTNTLAGIFGSAAVVAFLSGVGGGQRFLMAAFSSVVAIAAIIDLAASTTVMARLHSDLARRFMELERELERMKDPTEDALLEARSSRLRIEVEEPPIYRILDILCHNELVIACGLCRSEIYEVPWWTRIRAHFMDFGHEKIQKKASE